MIPKIIHHLAPRNRKSWHPIWNSCYSSFKKEFKRSDGFKHIMWTDEAIDNFIKKNYSNEYIIFSKCPKVAQIIQIDIARFFILYHYGGIYADMDYYCYDNFYSDLKKDVALVQSLAKNEIVQNSLMACTKNNKFIRNCLRMSLKRLHCCDINELLTPFPVHSDIPVNQMLIKNIGGPILLSDVYHSFEEKDTIQLLSKEIFNPGIEKYNDKVRTKHFLTGRWGNIVYETLKLRLRGENIDVSPEEYMIHDYSDFRLNEIGKEINENVNFYNYNLHRNYF